MLDLETLFEPQIDVLRLIFNLTRKQNFYYIFHDYLLIDLLIN